MVKSLFFTTTFLTLLIITSCSSNENSTDDSDTTVDTNYKDTSVLDSSSDKSAKDTDTDSVSTDDDTISTESDSETETETETELSPICLKPKGESVIQFTDVTKSLGLDKSGLALTGSNITVADINGDNWPDFVTTSGGHEREDAFNPYGYYRLLINKSGKGFEDATWSSGLFKTREGIQGRAATFVLFADVDNDGDEDAFVNVFEDQSSGKLPDQSDIYLNDGNGIFTPATAQSFTTGAFSPILSGAFVDYDHDGIVDLFTGQHFARYGDPYSSVMDSLFKGDGTGQFSDVSIAANVATVQPDNATLAAGTAHRPSWGVTACDLDGDGWPELMAAAYGRQLNTLFHNQKDGTFKEVGVASNVASDSNNDYSDNEYYLCYCQYHSSESVCAGANASVLVCDYLKDTWSPVYDVLPWRTGGNTSNLVCGDLDNDGDMDLLAVELAHWHIGDSSDKTEILYNDGFPAVPFSRPGNNVTGLERERITSWNDGDLGAVLADFDNDGRLDIMVASSDYPGTYSLLWHQNIDGTFTEVGAAANARIDRSHGLALIDYDRDGDYDIVSGTSLMRWSSTDTPPAPEDDFVYVLENTTGQDSNKLMIHLEGDGSANRDAIGARVTVVAGKDTYVREVQGGYGLTGFQQDKLMIIGIGAHCEVDSVTVRWPDAANSEEIYTGVMPNYVAIIRQGQPLAHQTAAMYAQVSNSGTEDTDSDTEDASCINGSTKCTGFRFLTCNSEGSWVAGEFCSIACNDTLGCVDNCTAGTTRCRNNEFQTCSENLQWIDSQTCPALCDDNTGCIGDCVPGEEYTCDNDNFMECDGTGTFQSLGFCENGCDPNIGCLCVPGETFCFDDIQIVTCDNDQMFTQISDCPAGCNILTDTCN
ncbi:MAG: CRTAC1 family protein [Deltaproteobacteria bacterium]|nr:CRTAC1 family protein [Deltaproteobacteria bacterium]